MKFRHIITNDRTLWLKVKNAEIDAFEALYKKHFNPLCLYACSIVPQKEIVKEIVNDVFLKIWDKAIEIDIKTEIKPYLYRCVHNSCIDYLDSKIAIQQKNTTLISEKIKELTHLDEENIIEILSYNEVENDVMKSIDLLPPQCKEIFLLSRFELLTYREISEKLNISVNTVKTQISRALDSLRQSLKKYI